MTHPRTSKCMQMRGTGWEECYVPTIYDFKLQKQEFRSKRFARQMPLVKMGCTPGTFMCATYDWTETETKCSEKKTY